MKAITDFHPKPVPSRSHDWSAVSPNYEPGDPIGYGPTEGEAIGLALMVAAAAAVFAGVWWVLG